MPTWERGTYIEVIDEQSPCSGWKGSVLRVADLSSIYCRMNNDPANDYVFDTTQLRVLPSLIQQKAVDPGHEKTVVNESGGKQSRLDYAVGSSDPLAVLAMGKVQAEGDAKYGRDNWRLISEGVHIEHALTHLALHRAGDTEEAHLAHALTRVHMAMAKHLRPDYYGEMDQ